MEKEASLTGSQEAGHDGVRYSGHRIFFRPFVHGRRVSISAGTVSGERAAADGNDGARERRSLMHSMEADGAVLPFLINHMGFDPAVASSPLIA